MCREYCPLFHTIFTVSSLLHSIFTPFRFLFTRSPMCRDHCPFHIHLTFTRSSLDLHSIFTRSSRLFASSSLAPPYSLDLIHLFHPKDFSHICYKKMILLLDPATYLCLECNGQVWITEVLDEVNVRCFPHLCPLQIYGMFFVIGLVVVHRECDDQTCSIVVILSWNKMTKM